MEIDLRQEKARLQEEKANLEAELASAVGAERRRLRVNIALVEEQMLDCQAQLRQVKKQESERKKNASVSAKSALMAAAQAAARDEAAKEDAYFQELLRRLENTNPPKTEHASLCEMAKSYRAQLDVLRHRIQLVSELRPRKEAEIPAFEERLRVLKAMYRDVRDIAVILERYYDPTYRRNERYMI